MVTLLQQCEEYLIPLGFVKNEQPTCHIYETPKHQNLFFVLGLHKVDEVDENELDLSAYMYDTTGAPTTRLISYFRIKNFKDMLWLFERQYQLKFISTGIFVPPVAQHTS